ncbi:MAG: NnrS family protein, partial [Neisseria sp.]|nr:NnrS family protein [Neisseria sp.]
PHTKHNPADSRRQLATFLPYPFRLYFLLGAISAVPAACAWAAAALGFYPLDTAPPLWHAFAFLQLTGGAAFAGFLFTAVPEWTHYTADLARHTLATLALWLAAWISACFSLPLAAAAMIPFWLYLAGFTAHAAWKARDGGHNGVILAVLAIAAATAVFAAKPDLFWLKQTAHLFAVGIVLIAFRIGKALGQKALEGTAYSGCIFVPNPFYRNLAACFLYAFVAVQTWSGDAAVSGWLAAAAGLAVLGRLREWHYPVLLKQYYVRWYYLMLAALGAGYIWQGASLLAGTSAAAGFHLAMLGGYLAMLMQVFSIAGAVHSSLKLHYPPSSRLSLFLIALAAFSRCLGVPLGWDYAWTVMYLPALLLSAAFLLYIPAYWRIFMTNPPLPVEAREKEYSRKATAAGTFK